MENEKFETRIEGELNELITDFAFFTSGTPDEKDAVKKKYKMIYDAIVESHSGVEHE